jgi:gas vesicle protein
MAEKMYGGEFMAGFLVGALVGAAAALLLAPQSGEETRTLIREKGIELGQRAEDLSAEARRKAEDLQLQAKDKADEIQAQAKDRAGSIQTKVKQAVEEGKSAAAKRHEELLGQLEKEQGDQEISL